MKRVLLTQPIRPVGMEILANEAEVVVAPDRKEETILNMVGDFDALINRTTSIGKEIIEKGKKLQVIGSHGVGFNLIDVETATGKGICVVNTPGANAQAVAEFVVAMMLALTRKLIPSDYVQRVERRFDKRDQLTGNDLHQKTLSILGMGQIGRKVAKICMAGFDMKVIGYDPFVSQEEMAAMGITKSDSVDYLFQEGDFVSINCPYTKEVEGMVDKAKFALMKPGAYLINCGRAEIINQQDFIDALKTNRIAGAAIDVFWEEPPAQDSPVFDLPNLIATPHMASFTNQSSDLVSKTVATDVLRVLRGEKPLNLVNKSVFK